nr:DUF2510 domain-containing protein [Mycolicibacter sinensis]
MANSAMADPQANTTTTAAHNSNQIIIRTVTAIVAVILGGAVIFYLKTTHDTAMRNAAIISTQQSSSKAAAAQAERKQEEDDAKRTERRESIKTIEDSVKELAEQHVQDGLIDGPILSVSCSPVGGSTDDLTAQTTIFACFVANTVNEDGTLAGPKYHAMMNWDTDEFTYGYGPPR